MKIKNKSYHEVKINGFTIGFAVSLYHYYSATYSVVSTELIPFPTTLHSIPTLIFNDPWPTYIEDNFINPNRDESQIGSLLSQMFSNILEHQVEIIKLREAYNLRFNINDSIYSGFLVHEKQLTPNFKQVQLFPNNELYRYDINKPDHEIEQEIVDIIRNKI